MKMRITMLALAFAVISSTSAQVTHYCHTSEIDNQLISEHPEILIERQKLEDFTQKFISSQATQKSAAVIYTIPVVFHIIHNYGSENITDAQVYDAIAVLNRDFNKGNADTAGVISQFKSKIANCGFKFALAQIDPLGKCTNGIDRIPSIATYSADNGAKFNPWPNNKYLNIWVVRSLASGAAGFAYYPGSTGASTDGIMVLNSYVGSIGTSSPTNSRAVTHEVGHYLNLIHTWGSTNNPGVDCGSDLVSDTPTTKGWDFCPTPTTGISCAGAVENYQNFMDYSYCYAMFTTLQASRMTAALNNSLSGRNNLWTTANLAATGVSAAPNLCKAEFSANKTITCEGGTITFTDASWNGTPTTWSWSFPGGVPSTASTSSVTVTYSTAGVYNATLTVGNGTTSPTITKTNMISVVANLAANNLPFIEGFESGAVPNSNWAVVNIDNKATWATTSTAKYSGTSCVWLNNYANDTAQVDELFSPTFDLTTKLNPKLYYKVAYAQKTTSSNDVLKVMVSTNCGVSWAVKQTKSGATLKSVPPQTTVFKPTLTSQWRVDSTVSLAAYGSYKNVRIKFQFTNAEGNNIYIDDININGSTLTAINDELTNNINFNVYPNPLQDRSVVAFNLVNKAKVSVKMYDILGKEVYSVIDSQQLSGGEYKYPFNSNGMKPGVYFVKLMVDDKLFVQKAVVQ